MGSELEVKLTSLVANLHFVRRLKIRKCENIVQLEDHLTILKCSDDGDLLGQAGVILPRKAKMTGQAS